MFGEMRLVDTALSEKRIIIIGAGNVLCRDEGLGVHIIEKLREYDLHGNVTLIDAGTATVDAFIDSASADKVVVIDAVQAGGAPGSIYHLSLEDISAEKGYTRTSLHQISLCDSFNMARLLMDKVPEVIVIGVEPESIESGLELSPSIRKRKKKIIEIILRELDIETRGVL
jgi:hydrogenase maturation protease